MSEEEERCTCLLSEANNEGAGSSRANLPSSSYTDQENNILNTLNYYCLMNIFSYLNIVDLLKTERVSKKWRELIISKVRGTREIKIGVQQIEIGSLRYILKRCGENLKKMSLNHTSVIIPIRNYFNRSLQPLLSNLKNLTHLNLCGVSCGDWKLILSESRHLKSVRIEYCYKIQDTDLKRMKCNLEELYLTRAHVNGDFLKYFSSLKVLRLLECFGISAKVFRNRLRKHKNLQKLYLDSCDRRMYYFLPAHCLTNLTEFSCTGVSYERNSRINIEILGHLKELQVLILANNTSIVDETLLFISSNLPKLTTLDVSGRQVDISDEGIKHLWKLPNLKTLTISSLKNVCNTAFDTIGIHESKLQTLVCQHIAMITNGGLLKVVQMCPDIRRIDAYGCKRLTDELVKSASELMTLPPKRENELLLHFKVSKERQRAINSLKYPLVRALFVPSLPYHKDGEPYNDYELPSSVDDDCYDFHSSNDEDDYRYLEYDD